MVTPSPTLTPGAEEDARLDGHVAAEHRIVAERDRLRRQQRDPGEHDLAAPPLLEETLDRGQLDPRIDAEHLVRVRLDCRDPLSGGVGELDDIGEIIVAGGVGLADLVEEGRAARAGKGHDAGVAEADGALGRRGVLDFADRDQPCAVHDQPAIGGRIRRAEAENGDFGPLGELRPQSPQGRGRHQRRIAIKDEDVREAGRKLLLSRQAPHAPCRAAPRCSWMAACGDCLATKARTAAASGPTTTAIRVAPASPADREDMPEQRQSADRVHDLGQARPHPRPLAGGEDHGEAGLSFHGGSHRPGLFGGDHARNAVIVEPASAEPRQAREHVEEPVGERRDLAGDEQNAGEHEESSHGLLDLGNVAAEAAHEMHERRGEEAGDQEGNAEAEGVDREQDRAAGDGLLRAGNGENCRQHRAYAGRPPDGEGEAHQIGADRTGRTIADIEPRLAIEKRDPQQAEKMKPHHDDDRPGNDGYRGELKWFAVPAQQGIAS